MEEDKKIEYVSWKKTSEVDHARKIEQIVDGLLNDLDARNLTFDIPSLNKNVTYEYMVKNCRLPMGVLNTIVAESIVNWFLNYQKIYDEFRGSLKSKLVDLVYVLEMKAKKSDDLEKETQDLKILVESKQTNLHEIHEENLRLRSELAEAKAELKWRGKKQIPEVPKPEKKIEKKKEEVEEKKEVVEQPKGDPKLLPDDLRTKASNF